MAASTSHTFWFKSRKGDETLTDVVISISIKGGSEVVTAASMTHSAYGDYYYTYNTTTAGTYIASMSSASERTSSSSIVVLTITSTATDEASTQTQYATTLQVFEYLNWVLEMPNYPVTTTLETIDDSGTLVDGSKIYLDNGKVIDGTQTISYGSDANNVTALTETTDYTIDNDKACITINATGAAKISTASVFGEYKYNNYVTDSFVSDLIDRASAEIEEKTLQAWDNLTVVSKEEHIGKGPYNRLYKPRKLPPLVLKPTLSSAVATTTATTFQISDTTDIEVNDLLTVNNEVVSVTSVTSATEIEVSRGIEGSTASTHNADDWLINMMVQISNTQVGTDPTWNTLGFRNDFDTDSDTGAVQLLHVNSEDRDELSSNLYPPQSVFNRLRMTYKYGTSTVPVDLQDLTIMMVAYKLMSSAISKSLPEGIDGFSPTAQQELKRDIKDKLNEYRSLLIGMR